MNKVHTQNVSSSYGKCRCCLAKGNHQKSIDREFDKMFKEYLNLCLITDSRLTQLMCVACVTFIRDVQRFRTMVGVSERQLLAAVDKETVFIDAEDTSHNNSEVKEKLNIVKMEGELNDHLDSSFCTGSMLSDIIEDNLNESELKTENEIIEDYLSDVETCEDAESEIKFENQGAIVERVKTSKECRKQLISKTLTNKRRIIDGKRKSPRKRKKYDSESDTPISEIKEKKAKVKKKSLIKEKPETVIKPNTTHSKQDSLKDNNKIRANIILLLKYSTILPFRNNFRTSFKCFYCEKFYIPFRELKEHIESEHLEICENSIDKCLRSMQDLILSADISCIKCRLCHAEFKTIENVTEHLTFVHRKMFYNTVRKPSHGILGFNLSSDTLKCHVCDKDFAFFKNLSIHMNEHYGLFVCYVCGKKFLSEHRYKCHVFNHHEGKETKCKHCGEIFKTEASMAYHIKKEHLKRTITCPKCPETFPFTQYIKRLNHMAVVHGIKKPVFKCDTCGKDYANSGSLAAHKRYTHKRTKEHRCEICGYITVHNTVMKNHMDVHNGVKNYECEFCKKKFAKPYTLKLHLKIHLNDKRFVCSLCDAAFIQKNSLKNHVKARHPDSGIDISKL